MPVASVIYKFKSHFALVRVQLVLLLEVKEVRLSPREIDAFTWIVIEGWNEATHNKIRELKVLKGNGINNLGSKLSKKSLLVQSKKGVKVLPDNIRIFFSGFIKAGFCTESYINQIQNGGKEVVGSG